MEDPFWGGISHAADLLTIIASAVVLAGVVVTIANRPRLSITPAYEKMFKAAKVTAVHHGGTYPARYVRASMNILIDGIAKTGDGLEYPTLLINEQVAVYVYDSSTGFTPPTPLPWQKEMWLGIDEPRDVIFAISRQRTLLSWTRTVRAVRWTVQDQAAGNSPTPIRWGSIRHALRAAQIPV